MGAILGGFLVFIAAFLAGVSYNEQPRLKRRLLTLLALQVSVATLWQAQHHFPGILTDPFRPIVGTLILSSLAGIALGKGLMQLLEAVVPEP